MVQIKFTQEFNEQPANIKVMGLGGAGGNAINRMIEAGLSHVEFIAANTDSQALRRNLAPVRLQLGETATKGLGVGGNPSLGRQATEESRDRIQEILTGADMVFITAGMGGGTGTGSAPLVAQIAKSLDPKPLVVGVITRPLNSKASSERTKRTRASMHTMAATSPPFSTKSPKETSSGCKMSSTRWSKPSYRPHNNIWRGRRANSSTDA